LPIFNNFQQLSREIESLSRTTPQWVRSGHIGNVSPCPDTFTKPLYFKRQSATRAHRLEERLLVPRITGKGSIARRPCSASIRRGFACARGNRIERRWVMTGPCASSPISKRRRAPKRTSRGRNSFKSRSVISDQFSQAGAAYRLQWVHFSIVYVTGVRQS